jgi:putative flavoprotein involved in K+ transport
MWRTDTVVVGAGQAGLAMSCCLTEAGIDHLVLERGRVAQRWRDERRRSLRLLTPNWMSRLPGARYDGPEPDGFMAVPALVAFLQHYARVIEAPVAHDTPVRAVRCAPGGYRVVTADREIACRAVVVATGACQQPRVPAVAAGLHPGVVSLTPDGYRDPATLPAGGVLVIGASATGVQLAAELRAAGREVVLAVGRHTRLPRTYRGRDIHAWLDLLGVLRRPVREGAGRAEPSAQLVGSPERREVDLATLQRAGVRLAGRLSGVDGTRVGFADDLGHHTSAADERLARLLARIDAVAGPAPDAADSVPAAVATGAPRELDLAARGISTVVWATGYRRSYPWLQVPVLDPKGEILHRGGLTPAPGLFVLGLPGQRKRNSTFLDGVGDDARFVAQALRCHLGSDRSRPSGSCSAA